MSQAAAIGARLTAARLTPAERAEFALLAALHEFGALSQIDLYRHLPMSAETLAGLVARLHQHDHVIWRTDPADRRKRILASTRTGQRHFEELRAHVDQVQAAFLQVLDEVERRQLHTLLLKLTTGHAK